VPSIICATTEQCVLKLGDDACKTNITCDPVDALCKYKTLDTDGDGHPPIVCGGDDCNDGDATQFPGHPEDCDGKDNNCNGPSDDGATCAGLSVCQGGGCVCPPENTCGSACVDKQKDPNHCGTCDNTCPPVAVCANGQCDCPGTAEICNGLCVNTQTDPNNCNGCGNTCGPGYSCKAGACTCLKTSCNGACIDTQSDPNFCGSCSVKCPTGGLCQLGMCKCPAGTTVCGSACVDTKTDPKNCGGCNTTCSACQNSVCIQCPTVNLFIEQDLSGSMDLNVPTGITRWDAARNGISNFVIDPLSAGLGIGIGYYPVDQSCVVSTDCGSFGTCSNGFCFGVDSCKASDYAIPAVSLGLLPASGTAILNSINSRGPTAATPQAPALQGALTYAKSHAIANASHKVAVVLITDGLPNECTPPDVPTDVANIAATFASGTPQVKTFVIGIGTDVQPPSKWSAIAAAGGTGTAYLTNSQVEIQNALNDIRSTFNTCP
jgi:hypothetical protein